MLQQKKKNQRAHFFLRKIKYKCNFYSRTVSTLAVQKAISFF